jgi:hypothetical protein
MEQKLEEKMQCFLSNGIQYHQAILRWGLSNIEKGQLLLQQ